MRSHFGPVACGPSIEFEVTVELDAAKVDVVEVAVDANEGATAVEVGTVAHHRSGGTYELVRDGEPGPAPGWWVLEALRKTPRAEAEPKARRPHTRRSSMKDDGPIAEGTGNFTLTKYVGQLRGRGYEVPEILETFGRINHNGYDPPSLTPRLPR